MSSGSFIRSIYETNSGNFARIRVQPETELATDGTTPNDAAIGPVNLPVAAKVSRGAREYGIRPRRIGLVFEDGNEPSGYESGNIIYIPALTRAFFDALDVDQQITYLGETANVVSKLEEDLR
jgi:hypothetical protein